VKAAIEELDFYPDINARTLGSGRSRLFGLIISDITNPYFPELVKAFEDIAMEHGQDVLIANTDYDPKRMERCVVRMMQRKVEGVAVMTSEMEEHLLRKFSKRQIPTVFMDTSSALPGASIVRVDYHEGVRQAMSHLVSLKHERIAFISGPLKLSSASWRVAAFTSALREYDLRTKPHWFQEGNHHVEGGQQAMLRILHAGPRPTAVLTSNDLTAIGAMGAIHQCGLEVPGDISVVGFDNIELSAFTRPALTTVHVPRRELADTAFHCLYPRQEQPARKKATKREYVITPSLIVRESTGPAPASQADGS
jgi:LacI family transcriptional regulator